MFKRRFYTTKQRKIYGWGWFAISMIIGMIFTILDWKILSYLAYLFAILSLYTGYTKTK